MAAGQPSLLFFGGLDSLALDSQLRLSLLAFPALVLPRHHHHLRLNLLFSFFLFLCPALFGIWSLRLLTVGLVPAILAGSIPRAWTSPAPSGAQSSSPFSCSPHGHLPDFSVISPIFIAAFACSCGDIHATEVLRLLVVCPYQLIFWSSLGYLAT